METKDIATFLRSKDFIILKDIGQGGTGKTKLLGNYIQSYSLKPLKSYKFSN